MTQLESSNIAGALPSRGAISDAARIVWVALILATLYLSYFYNLGAIGLVGPDEPRYAWIARDMAESGDWVTPRLYGKPWFEKPVLYYWGAAASFKLFGVSETAARLPSALCAFLATLAMAWLAWRLYGEGTARWVLLLLPTTVGMIGFSHAAATDMPFSGMLTVAMVLAASIVGLVPPAGYSIHTPTTSLYTNTRPGGLINLVLFGFFLGLAVLAKGPAAIILSGSAVLLWATITKRWSDAFHCLHPVAIGSFCATALPWYVLCARRNPDFFRVFIIEHNFKRFLTPEFQHIQPFWYYIPIILIAFIPWAVALLSTTIFGLVRSARGQRLSHSTTFLFCWAMFCLLFFSISKSKLPGYILPAIPAVGLLLARSIDCMKSGESKVFRGVQMGAGALLALAGATVYASHINNAWVGGSVLLAMGIANVLLGLKRAGSVSPSIVNAYSVVPILFVLIFFKTMLPHYLMWDPSGKQLANEIMSKQIPLDEIYVANMGRGQEFSLNFYLHREMQEWDTNLPAEGFLLMKTKRCRELVRPPFVCQTEDPEPNPSGWFIYRVKRKE